MFDILKHLKFNHYALVLSGIGGLVSPGLMHIIHFRPELLFSLDIFKLLLVCVTLSLPTALIILLSYLTLTERSGEKPFEYPDTVWIGTTLTNLLLHSGVVISAYLLGFTFRSVAIVLGLTSFALFGWCIIFQPKQRQ